MCCGQCAVTSALGQSSLQNMMESVLVAVD